MKRTLNFIWDVLREIGEARARSRMSHGSWDY